MSNFSRRLFQCFYSSSSTPQTTLISATAQMTEIKPVINGTLWFNNIFPVQGKLSVLGLLPVKTYAKTMELNALSRLIPKSLKFESYECVANVKEGGMLLRYKYRGNSLEVLSKVNQFLLNDQVRSMYNLLPVRAYEVMGEPFVDDMLGHFPNRKLRVEFEGPDVHLETLFTEFRKFGRILDITSLSQSSKDLPRYATVTYAFMRDACAARSCLHAKKLDNTRISIIYEKNDEQSWFYKWLRDHPRITIPILLALLAGMSFLIFDPIRAWFVTNKLTGRYSFAHYKDAVSRYLMGLSENNHFLSSLLTDKKNSDEDQTWKERRHAESRITTILKESPNTLLLVNGPKGSGKSELVHKALKKVKYKIVINCDELVGTDDYEMMSRMSKQTGFFPELTFLVQFGAIIDAIVLSLTATKSNVGSTADSQVQKILDSLTLAMSSVQRANNKERNDWIKRNKNQKGISQPAAILAPDMAFPVIVIEGFMTKATGKNAFLYEMLTTWASNIVASRLAHVLFVSSNPSSSKALNKAMSIGLENIILDDAPVESAMSYVRSRLGNAFTNTHLLGYVEGLGGRQTDLETLIQKIRAGSSAEDSFQEIVLKSVADIRKITIEKQGWTQPQIWKVCQQLAQKEEIDFDDLKFHALFNGDESALTAMENSGLVSILNTNGRPTSIRAGRPVYREAFNFMIKDAKLVASMGVLTFKSLQSSEQAKIVGYEAELRNLTEIVTGNGSDRNFLSRSSRNTLEDRIYFLTGLLGECQKKYAEYEDAIRKHKKNLQLK